MYKEIENYIVNNFKEREINEEDLSSFKKIFSKENNLELLKEVINNEELLKKISERSYTHALGFDKIVLFDMSKDTEIDNKVQLRLHLWNPNIYGVPLTESMHEHSFNFISTILKGKLENQIFEMSEISNLKLLNEYLNKLNKLKSEEKSFVNEQIELIEILKLSTFNSMQYSKEIEENCNLDKLKDLLSMQEENLFELTKYQGHYVSNRVRGEKKAYKHIFDKNVELKCIKALQVSEGDYYFHPYQYPHRLHYDNKELNSTLLITTPIPSNPQGGSLQRPSYLEENEKGYEKLPITEKDLKNKILYLINEMEN